MVADAADVRAPGPPQSRPVRNPISRIRVETAIARSAAGFGVAFFVQSLASFAGQVGNLHPAWCFAVVAALVLSLLVAGIASLLGRALQPAFTVFPLVYLAALVTWPFAVLDAAAAPTESFWLYFLLTVATVMATIGMDLRWAVAYLVAVPAVYAVVRVIPQGGGVGLDRAALDSIYAIILGGFVTIIATVLRDTASAVDRAQATALSRYAHAVRHHATEAERVRVDSIVHDGVLTTLLAAARAYTPEAKALAARMASDTIGYLRDAVASAPGSGAEVSGGALATRIESAAGAMSAPIEVRIDGLRSLSLPLHVAEALYSAAVQGMVNSLQHAGHGVSRWAEIRGSGDEVDIEIGDDGRGFDLAAIPTERLGVRVSILERLAGAGGRAEIDSAPGRGTRVRMHWPDDEAVAGPSYDEFAAGSEAPDEARDAGTAS